MDDFRIERVTEKIYRIVMQYVCCYLIIGKNEAALIDTGWGYGNLKEVVQSLTSLPVKVLLTHGHADHIGGVSQFSDVYLHLSDHEIAIHNNAVATRQQIFEKLNLSVSSSDEWQAEFQSSYHSLANDYNLGGVTIIPVHVPGHTKGSVAFILAEERIAIFGDACSHPTLLTLEESTTVETHYHALLNLKRYEKAFDAVLVSHETFEIDKIVLSNSLMLAENILKGIDKKIPIVIHETKAVAAREKEEWLPRQKELIGSILYREGKIYN